MKYEYFERQQNVIIYYLNSDLKNTSLVDRLICFSPNRGGDSNLPEGSRGVISIPKRMTIILQQVL